MGLGIGTYTFLHRAVTEHLNTYNCGMLDFKPTSMPQFCAEVGAGVATIKWETWQESGAMGTGQYAINVCDPSCAEGKWKFADVKVKLSQAVRDQNKTVLSRIDIVTIDGKNLPHNSSPDLGWDLERRPLPSVK